VLGKERAAKALALHEAPRDMAELCWIILMNEEDMHEGIT
jgi:hypothetical protein